MGLPELAQWELLRWCVQRGLLGRSDDGQSECDDPPGTLTTERSKELRRSVMKKIREEEDAKLHNR